MASTPQFIKALQDKLPKNVSIIEEIASVLKLNYAAAYRRVNGKTTLSLEEAIILSKYYQVSLDALFSTKSKVDKGNVAVLMTPKIDSEESLEKFFAYATGQFKLFKELDIHFISALKDIPTYYFTESAIGRKFILYIYTNLFGKNSAQIKFSDYKPSYELLENIESYSKAYNVFQVKEIWNSNTINSTIYRILYLYNIDLITSTEATELCNMLKAIVAKLNEKASKGYKLTPERIEFDLYFNDLFSLNNSGLFINKNDEVTAYIFPYAPLSYYRIENNEACETLKEYFDKQLRYSQLLSGTGEAERQKFINSMLSKIDTLKQRVQQKVDISF